MPKAKFPVIDIHGHPGNLSTPEGITRVVTAMDALNIKVLVSADNLTGSRLKATLDAIAASPHKDRFRVLCGIDLGQVGPGWAERAVKQLEADVAAGAVGVGEISKAGAKYDRGLGQAATSGANCGSSLFNPFVGTH